MKDYWHPFYQNCFYHIYNRSNNKETIFLNEDNYTFFLGRWDKYFASFFDTYTYALIPNHFHFLIKVKSVDELFLKAVGRLKTVASRKFRDGAIPLDEFIEDQVKNFCLSYAKAFNEQNGRKGSVFQKRFKRVQIKAEHHLQYMVVYHHHNPIHHKITKEYPEWRFTSYKAILSRMPTRLCRQEVLALFHPSDEKEALKLFNQAHAQFKVQKKMENLIFGD